MATLLHLSDIHFGPKHLEDRSAAVLGMVERQPPDLVVVSGDLTQRAKVRQFRAARQFFTRLAAPAVFVPGNHDVPLWRFWERLFAPFGAWRRGFDSELVRDFFSPALAVVGVNTAHAWTTKHGRIRRGDISGLAGRFTAAGAGAFRVLVAHHPIVAAPELGDEPVARRGGELIAAARRCGVELVLSGHLHHAFEVPAERALPGGGPLVLQCGTTTSSRGRGAETGHNSLHRITVEPDGIVVERHLWCRESRAFELAVTRRHRRAGTASGRDIIRRS